MGGCSGVALDTQWVLTASHCPNHPESHLFYPSSWSDVTERTDFPAEDIALVRVNHFDSTLIKPLQMWNGAMSSLAGQTLTCIGQGENPPEPYGTWRWASLQVSSTDATGYATPTNAAGQLPAHGDSGGPCVLNNKITGIISRYLDPQRVYSFGLTPSLTARIDDIRYRSRLFFYNAYNGTATTPAIERAGWFNAGPSMSGFTWYWDIVLTLRNGVVIFYKRSNDLGVVSHIKKDGSYAQVRVLDGFGGKWTHATAVGPDRVFFYNSNTGTAKVVKVTPTWDWIAGPDLNFFSTGWTHIVGTANGGLFFYNRNTITGAAGRIERDYPYSFVQTGTFYGMSDWTHITAFGQQEILFYNQSSGLTYHAWMSDQGVYYSIGVLTGVAAGFWTLVGTTNGYLFFMDPWGSGLVGRPTGYGGLAYSRFWNLPTGYTHISGE